MNYIIEREKNVKKLLIILIIVMTLFIGVSIFVYLKNKENTLDGTIDVEANSDEYTLVETKEKKYEVSYVEEYLDNAIIKNTVSIEVANINVSDTLDKNEITITEMNKVGEETALSLEEGNAGIKNENGNVVITYNNKEYKFYNIKTIYYNNKQVFLLSNKYIYYGVNDTEGFNFYKRKCNNYEKLYYSSISTNFGSISDNYYDLNTDKMFDNNYFYYLDGNNYIKTDRTFKFNNIDGIAKVILLNKNDNRVVGIIDNRDVLIDFVDEVNAYTSNKKVLMVYTGNNSNIIRFEDNTYYTHKFEECTLVY